MLEFFPVVRAVNGPRQDEKPPDGSGPENDDGRMAGAIVGLFERLGAAEACKAARKPVERVSASPMRWRALALITFFTIAVLAAGAGQINAQTDCLACHGDQTMTDSAGHQIGVDGDKFGKSIHGSMKCNDCHAGIKEYPHPENPVQVQCATCHAEEQSALKASVHADGKEHPCTSCHGDAHAIFPRTDPQSSVYPLNVPATCGKCHGNDGLAQKHGLPSVYPSYVDSIHGTALNKEGLLVAANCQSCHGSHSILSHNDAKSPTNKANIPNTCGGCHAKINMDFESGVHGKAIAAGKMKAPVCTDCHTAHQILQPTESEFRTQSTPVCGSCHADKLSTYRDTFHSQLGSLGGYVETARCWDCHGAHDVRPASDPHSPVAKANLVETCGRCHAGANARFVQYQPHADARNFRMNPALYFVRLFMNLLLIGVLTFFVIHTILWLVRSRHDQVKNGSNGGNHA